MQDSPTLPEIEEASEPQAATDPPVEPSRSPEESSQADEPSAERGAGTRAPAETTPNLAHATYYLNRELSWVEFNRRVLEEALDPSNPLLERVKFLSIFSSNLDEFFMVRVSGLQRQLTVGTLSLPPDGMTPGEQLAAIHDRLEPMHETVYRLWHEELKPALAEQDVRVLAYSELKKKQRKLLRRHFRSEIFPVLTPLAFDPGHPFPHISNLSINLAVVISDPGEGVLFARVKVPHLFPRLLAIPSEEKADSYTKLGLKEPASAHFVWLEEVVAANIDLLFPGMEIVDTHSFRVTRDADIEIRDDEASDLLETMQEVVEQRHFGSAVRLEIDRDMPQRVREILIDNLRLAPYQVDDLEAPLGLSDLMQLTKVDRPALKDPPFLSVEPAFQRAEESVFAAIRRHDRLLYHPYDSFSPIVDLVREAARDPDVLAIKQTLYRVGPDSPIVAALEEARELGKQVAAMVELKARFDEENNIRWARRLEQAGVHVVYGVLGLKIHAKLCLIVRREGDGIARYLHLGTGNYNPITARIYTDLGYLTADPELTEDVSNLFNSLTGYARKQTFQRLLVAPHSMRQGILERIEREIELHRREGGGHLVFKCNALVDKACIRALYQASRAGVKVDLQIRGICCLRPGIERVSENITVTSIVGRFLEHPRIYYFRNGGDEEILLGSADLMPRNLDGRIEVLFPVVDPFLRRSIRDDILFPHLADNVQARTLLADGNYERRRPTADEPTFDSQRHLLEHRGSWHRDDAGRDPRADDDVAAERPNRRQ